MAHSVVNPPPTDKQPFPQRKPVSKEEGQDVMRRMSEDSVRQQQRIQQQQPMAAAAGAGAGPTSQMADDSNKVEMIEFIEGVRSGRLPNNAQIEHFLDRLLNIRAIQERQHLMSADGQRLLADIQELIQTLKTALYVKNQDQLFQSLYYHLFSTDYQRVQRGQGQGPDLTGGASKQEMKEEAKEGGNAMYKVFKLVIMNSDFRDQLSELMSIAQEVFSDASGKLSGSMQKMSQQVDEQGQQLNERFQDMANQGQSQLDEGDFDTGKAKQSIRSRVDDAKQQSPQAKSKAKQQMQQQGQQAKDYARQKFPPEKVDDIVDRLKSVLGQVQQHPDYQQALDTIFSLVQKWSYRAANVTQSSTGYASQVTEEFRSDPSWSAAELELKTIIEDWAQGRSLDPLLHAVETTINDVTHDPELKQCYNEATQYLRRLAKEPNYAISDESTEDGKYMVERVRQVTEGRYRSHADFLVSEGKAFMLSMEQDPMAREIEQRFKKIHNDLWLDADGNTAFKPNLLTDMRLTLIPAAMELIKFIPVPAIEYSDREFDVAVENVVLPGDTLLPGFVEVKMDNYIKFSPYSDITNANQQSFWIKMTEINTTIPDVVWYYKRKKGFPKLYDRGVATITIGGRRRKGMTVDTQIISDTNDPVHTFRVAHCKAHIDHLKVKFKGSRHNLLYRTFQPMATSIVKRQIAKAVEAKIIETVEKADAKLTASMMQNYQEALNKNASLDDLATRNAAMREQQQLQQPTQQQQQQQPMSPMAQVTSAVGQRGGAQQQADTTMPMQQPTTTMPRPSLTTGLFTILNRNIKTNMVRSLQDQQSKHRRRKAEKEAARKEREQQQAKEEEEKARGAGMGGMGGMGQIPSSAGGAEGGPAGTVPVIVGQDGKMYIANEQGRLVPVTIAGEEQQQQQQQKKPSQKQKQRGKGPSLGKQGFNKVADEMGTGNQDIGQQQATAAAPNVM